MTTSVEQTIEVNVPIETAYNQLYFEDPAGNVVELWDFFRRGDGAAEGVRALAAADD